MKFREYLNRFVHRFILWDNLYKLVDNYEKSQYWSKEQLEEMQLSRLKEILLFSMKNTRHYARLLKNLEVNSFHDIDSLLSDLPVLEKEMLINNIELFKPSDSVRLKYKKNSTSGSSGRKLIFYTELYNYHTQAIRYRSEKWMGLGLFPKTYTIWGANWDVSLANNGFKNRLKSWFKNSVVLNGYNLRDRDMENYLIQMRKANVEKLVSYPSILYALAKYSKENKLPLDPKVVVSAGERLYDYQRILIESVFKCKVFNFLRIS
jgi:phenylacetate-CoA ligase